MDYLEIGLTAAARARLILRKITEKEKRGLLRTSVGAREVRGCRMFPRRPCTQ